MSVSKLSCIARCWVGGVGVDGWLDVGVRVRGTLWLEKNALVREERLIRDTEGALRTLGEKAHAV